MVISNAERQKRYRQKRKALRNAQRNETVTDKPISVTVECNGIVTDVTPVTSDLPDCVPDIIKGAYQRLDDKYRQTIDRLVQHTLTELKAMGIWIPCWRYNIGEDKLVA